MIAVLLCAGFATRMYPVTRDFPKPLLSVADRPVLDYLMDQLVEFDGLEAIHVVTNARFLSIFKNWRCAWEAGLRERGITLTLHNDGAMEPEQRRGAIRDLSLVLDAGPLPDGAFVAAGDSILRFPLLPVWQRFRETGAHHVLAVPETDTAKLQRAGVIEFGHDHRVLRFVEKSDSPPAPWICPAHYFLHASSLRRVAPYLAAKRPADAPGHFIADLLQHETVYAFPTTAGRFDIGSLADYLDADRTLRREPVFQRLEKRE